MFVVSTRIQAYVGKGHTKTAAETSYPFRLNVLAARQSHGSPLRIPSDITNGGPGESAKKKRQKNGCPEFFLAGKTQKVDGMFVISIRIQAYVGKGHTKTAVETSYPFVRKVEGSKIRVGLSTAGKRACAV